MKLKNFSELTPRILVYVSTCILKRSLGASRSVIIGERDHMYIPASEHDTIFGQQQQRAQRNTIVKLVTWYLESGHWKKTVQPLEARARLFVLSNSVAEH